MAANKLPDSALPFHLFMIQHGEQEFNAGRALSYDQLRIESLPRWNHITKVERDEYKRRAQIEQDDINKKIQNIHAHDAKLAEIRREKANTKNRLIKEYFVQKLKSSEDWKAEEFILADVNIFAMTKDDVFPAEMALSKFSLNEGLIESIHFHINMDTRQVLPHGLLCTARMLSEDTHLIPLAPGPREGKFIPMLHKDIQKKIKDFLGLNMRVFTLHETNIKHDVIEAVERTMKNTFGIDVIAIPLQELFREMKVKMGEANYGIIDVSNILITNSYSVWSSIACMHHFEVDAPLFCSLARVKRWAFHICRLILSTDELQQGRHIPSEAEKANENQMIFEIDKTVEIEPDLQDTYSASIQNALNHMKEKEQKENIDSVQNDIENQMKEMSINDNKSSSDASMVPQNFETESEYGELDIAYFINEMDESCNTIYPNNASNSTFKMEDESSDVLYTTAKQELSTFTLPTDEEYGELDLTDLIFTSNANVNDIESNSQVLHLEEFSSFDLSDFITGN